MDVGEEEQAEILLFAAKERGIRSESPRERLLSTSIITKEKGTKRNFSLFALCAVCSSSKQ